MTLGQAISGWVAQFDEALENLRLSLGPVYAPAIGGTVLAHVLILIHVSARSPLKKIYWKRETVPLCAEQVRHP